MKKRAVRRRASDRHTKLTIATLMFAGFMIGTDFIGSVLLVASLEQAFKADITTTQWVLNIYALTYAVFMVAAGRLVFPDHGLIVAGSLGRQPVPHKVAMAFSAWPTRRMRHRLSSVAGAAGT